MHIVWTLIIICCFLFLLYILIPAFAKIILRHFFLLSLKKECVYLTFDDGPNPESTPQILAILKKHEIKATFFITGRNIEKNPALINQIIFDGHGLGIHGYDHLHAWKTAPVKTLIDFLKFNQACANHGIPEEKLNLYRPPYGKLNIISLIYILLTKKKIIFWDIDPNDYSASSSQAVIDSVQDVLETGNVILLHDGRSNLENSPVSITINSLEPIIITIKNRGRSFCSFN